LDALRAIVEAVGAVVQSHRDGGLRVQYRYPLPVRDWARAVPAHVITDSLHTLSADVSAVNTDTYNAVYIGDSPAAAEFEHEYVAPDNLDNVGLIRVWAEPWVAPEFYLVSHTSLVSVLIGPAVVKLLEVVEQVEFKAGAAALQYPVYHLDAVEWRYLSLGDVTWRRDSKALSAPGGAGYSLAIVRYRRRVAEFRVSFGRPDNVQIILEML